MSNDLLPFWRRHHPRVAKPILAGFRLDREFDKVNDLKRLWKSRRIAHEFAR